MKQQRKNNKYYLGTRVILFLLSSSLLLLPATAQTSNLIKIATDAKYGTSEPAYSALVTSTDPEEMAQGKQKCRTLRKPRYSSKPEKRHT